MSRTCYKTTYEETGPYYSVLKKTMYVEHCHSSDTVSFYDEQGRMILCVEDTMDNNNMLDAINRLYAPFKKNDGGELKEGVETVSEKDIPDYATEPKPVVDMPSPEAQNSDMSVEEFQNEYIKIMDEAGIKQKIIEDSDHLKFLIEPLFEWPDEIISVEVKDKIRDLWCNKILRRLTMSTDFSKEDASYCKTRVEIEYFTDEKLLSPFTDKFHFLVLQKIRIR